MGLLIIIPAFATRAFAVEVAGEVASVSGQVFIRADGKNVPNLVPARPGDKVSEGDIINTGSNATIKLLLKDSSIIDIGPSALFKVNKFDAAGGADRKADMTMAYGSLRAAIPVKVEGKGHFNIKTRTATMGVRGTEFKIDASMPAQLGDVFKQTSQTKAANGAPVDGGVKLTVFQGQVAALPPRIDGENSRSPASDKAAVLVGAGQKFEVAANQSINPASLPTTLSKTELATEVASAKSISVDHTFTNAISIDMGTKNGSPNGPAGSNGGNGGLSGGIPGGASTLALISSAIQTATSGTSIAAAQQSAVASVVASSTNTLAGTTTNTIVKPTTFSLLVKVTVKGN